MSSDARKTCVHGNPANDYCAHCDEEWRIAKLKEALTLDERKAVLLALTRRNMEMTYAKLGMKVVEDDKGMLRIVPNPPPASSHIQND